MAQTDGVVAVESRGTTCAFLAVDEKAKCVVGDSKRDHGPSRADMIHGDFKQVRVPPCPIGS